MKKDQDTTKKKKKKKLVSYRPISLMNINAKINKIVANPDNWMHWDCLVAGIHYGIPRNGLVPILLVLISQPRIRGWDWGLGPRLRDSTTFFPWTSLGWVWLYGRERVPPQNASWPIVGQFWAPEFTSEFGHRHSARAALSPYKHIEKFSPKDTLSASTLVSRAPAVHEDSLHSSTSHCCHSKEIWLRKTW